MRNRVRDVILKRSSFIITLLLILSAVTLLRVASTHRDVDDVANIDLPLIELLTLIETNQLEQSISFEKAIRYAEETDRNDLAIINFAEADSSFNDLAHRVDQDLLDAELQVKKAMERTEQETQLVKLRGLLLSIQKLESDHTRYEEHAIEVLTMLEEGDLDGALRIVEKVEKEEDQFNKQIEGVLMRHEMFTEALVNIVEEEEVLSMKWIVTLTLLFVILSLIAVFTFSYTIWRPLEDIRNGAERLGAGDLDTRLKLRNSAITEDIVDAFNKMAADLQASQDEIDRFIHFSYSAANDLKAPIENITSLLEMLSKTDIRPSDYEVIVNNAKRSTRQLGETVNALNEVNKLRDKLSAKPEVISFDRILAEVGSEMKDEIKAAKAVIRKDFNSCKQIEYPRFHLKCLFHHLLSNAITYRNPDKPLHIHLKTSEENGKVSLTIKDTGLGFDAIKYRDDITKPFFRIHNHVDGSGLGMYIIKSVLDLHKGDLKMESLPKKGAKFTLILNRVS